MKNTIPLPAAAYALLIVLSMAIPQSIIAGGHLGYQFSSGKTSDALMALNTDLPISISSDADMISLASTEGWPGAGTADDPIIIEGLVIQSAHTCIRVTDTTLHFRIIDSFLESNGEEYGVGVSLDNVTNASLENVTIIDARYGIYVRDSQNCIFSRNSITSISDTGISIYESSSCEVLDNSIRQAETGIDISDSSNCSLRYNLIQSTNVAGINIVHSDGFELLSNIAYLSQSYGFVFGNIENCRVTNNTSVLNSGAGFRLERCTNCTFDADNAVQNEWDGITMQLMSSCIFKDNLLCTNAGYGIESFSGSVSSDLTNNSIGWNSNGNAAEYTSENFWLGNKWSDYNGSGLYQISGWANATDTSPSLLVDNLPPVIYGPVDIDHVLDNESFTLRWYAWDCQPSRFQIYLNGSMIMEQDWTRSFVQRQIGPLDKGVYTIKLHAYDINGNIAVDYVWVHVYSSKEDAGIFIDISVAASILLIALTIIIYDYLHPRNPEERHPIVFQAIRMTRDSCKKLN